MTQPPEIIVMSQQISPLCSDSGDGSIELTITGGVPDYIFLWNDQGGVNGPAIRTDLEGGDYDVLISDANGCETSASIVLPEPDPLELVPVETINACFGEENGALTVTAIGGTGDYVFTWDTGDTGPTIDNLSTGSYDLTITDANNCELIEQVFVGSLPEIVLSIEENMPSCNGSADGTLEVIAQGGSGDFTYLWSDDQQTSIATGLIAGTYSVTVGDQDQCQAEISFVLNEPTALEASTTSTLVGCNGASDGTATVEPMGGTLPYTYLWSDAAGQETQSAENLLAGEYTVTVTDANACNLVLMEDVQSATEIILSATSEDILCYGESTGSIQVEASGGTGTYNYVWSSGSIGNTPNPENLPAGEYTLTVSDMNGCAETINVLLTQPR